MRQGQQNRRGRGRSHNHGHNNNRKGQNPLTRSYESNGPDVKLRGTPAHIAEKYISLARDAQSSGDPVLAENYLQHAEHYNRIILAFREQHVQQGGDPNAVGRPRPGPGGEGFEGEEFDGEGDGMPHEPGFQQPPRGQEPQPQVMDAPMRAEGREFQPRQRFERHDQGRGQHGGHRHEQRRHRDSFGDAPREGQGERRPRPERFERTPAEAGGGEAAGDNVPGGESGGGFPRRRDRYQPPQGPALGSGPDQPDFLRRSVRRPRREHANGGDEIPEAPVDLDKPQDKSSV
jgi:hypothetical protein